MEHDVSIGFAFGMGTVKIAQLLRLGRENALLFDGFARAECTVIRNCIIHIRRLLFCNSVFIINDTS